MSFEGLHYRKGTSDERVLVEVITKRCYRRPTLGFDVEAGEHWLDLGANIGAFAVYCGIREARATCYEPDVECFRLLTQNVNTSFVCVNAAVTNRYEPMINFWRGKSATDHYRYTALKSGLPVHDQLRNVHGSELSRQVFNGVKMDIEGSEGGLIDDWLIPRCNKLVIEYHLSRDPSTENLGRRLDALKQHFNVVKYPKEFDRFVAAGGNAKSYFDRLIFCMEPIDATV